MRVPGLASNMDIEALVKNMMTAKRAPLDKMSQNKQLLEWRRESYREINSSLADFRYNKLDKYRLANATNVFSSTVSGNKTAVTAEATKSANQVTMNIKVERLASQTTASSPTLDSDKNLQSKLSQLAADGNVSGPFILEVSQGSGEPLKLEFSKDDTIQSVLNKINGKSEANLTASFDEASRKIIIKSKEYGADTVILSGSFQTDIMKITDDGGEDGTPNRGKLENGTSARVEINGQTHYPKQNELTINGVKLTFLEVTKDENSVVTTKPDGANLINTIKSFVGNYNSLIGALNSKINEQKYKDFSPLTAEQKEKMSEDEITKWETKAKSGNLKGDSIIKDALFQMRSLLWDASTSMGDKKLNLASIGITTGDYRENGKLYIDEGKLQQAIIDNPDEVIAIFNGNQGSKGLFQNMYDQALTPLAKLADKAGTMRFSADPKASFNEQSIMGKELTDLNSRMAAFSKKIKVTEDNLYRQFTAMEKAINKFNMQSASLANFAGQ
ncbi:hypothetical protein EBB07_06675 [Paenibacillaceae bacterium]|nr:hypothetical protein EBB07_06675 [Paenibacillaceae bacterium]